VCSVDCGSFADFVASYLGGRNPTDMDIVDAKVRVAICVCTGVIRVS
jgi:hypothetical protein